MTMPTNHDLRDVDPADTRRQASGAGRRVFISFHHTDTFAAALIEQRLAARFGPERVFLDRQTLRPGTDWRPELSQALHDAEVVLVLIGPDWVSAQQRRNWDPHDWIRQEIATALRLDLRVVPVLLSDAALPSAGELPDDLAALTRRQYWRVKPTTAAADISRLVDDLAEHLDRATPAAPPVPGVPPVPAVPEQLRRRLLDLLQARYRVDETDLEREFPGEPAAAVAATLVAEKLAEWGTEDRCTLVITPAGIEHGVRVRKEFDALLARSSFHSRGSSRLRRGVRAQDTARAVALANGDNETTAATLAALWMLLAERTTDRTQDTCRTQAWRTLATWTAGEHTADDDDLRLFLRDRVVDVLRVHLDDWTPAGADTCSTWRTLRNMAVHGTGDAEYLLTAVYRDRLRSFAATVAEDQRCGDRVADLVLRRGAEVCEVQVKQFRSGDDCPARPLAPSGSAACTSWLIGSTLQAARETGSLRRTVATWSDQCVAVAGTEIADAEVVGQQLRAGRWIVMDLAGASEPTARWLADFATGLACELGGAVHRVDRWVLLLSPHHGARSTTGNPVCNDLRRNSNPSHVCGSVPGFAGNIRGWAW